MAVAPGIDNLCGFAPMATQSSNSMMTLPPGACAPARKRPTGAPVDEHKRRSPRRGLPKNLHEFLTPRALAYWFMDDGTYSAGNKRWSDFFSTQSFPLEDQEILVQALKHNFSIHVTIQKDRSMYRL